MKKILITLAVILLAAALIAYLAYPVAARETAAAQTDRIIREYHRRIGRMSAEDILERMNNAAAYNETLTEIQPEDPFSGREVLASHRYEAPLNTGDGVLGILTVPGIGLRLPVYHESAERKAAETLVHIQGSALPADEPGTHVMLAGPGLKKADGFAGKIGLTGERMLEDADQLTPGDLLILNVLDRTLVYQVEWVQTMAPEGLARTDLAAGADEELLTLVTQERDRLLLVRGRRIPAKEAMPAVKARDQARPLPDWQSILLLGSPVILLGLIIIIVTERIKKRSYRLPVEQRKIIPDTTEKTRKEDDSHET